MGDNVQCVMYRRRNRVCEVASSRSIPMNLKLYSSNSEPVLSFIESQLV